MRVPIRSNWRVRRQGDKYAVFRYRDMYKGNVSGNIIEWDRYDSPAEAIEVAEEFNNH